MTQRLTVLIAAASDADRNLLSAFLDAEGYMVISVVNGAQAVVAFREHQPQMVLLDVLIPELGGREAARQIKALAGERFVPIVFLTSLNQAEELGHYVDAGGTDFLSRPYDHVVLRTKLAALERQQHTHETMLQQRDQIARLNAYLLHEQAAAKAVMDRVVHTGSLDSPNIKYLVSPLAVFNGDVLLAGFNPAGDLLVFVGDFTGHGLTAGIGAMPLAEVFYTMTEKGFSVGEIVREANTKLASILPPGYFCCATLVRICYDKGTLEYWSGGLPPGYLLRNEPRAIESLPSRHLPLGILGADKFSPKTEMCDFQPSDQLLLYTDGLLEARGADGEMFGAQRLEGLLATLGPLDRLFEEVRDASRNRLGTAARDDDVTLISVAMLAPEKRVLAPIDEVLLVPCVPQQWRFVYELGPESLQGFNPLPLMHQIIKEVPELGEAAGQISSVLAEAYSNALEHGVLGLASVDKQDASGFASYYMARDRALRQLNSGFIRFELDCQSSLANGHLRIRVIDSGSGFDHRARLSAVEDGSYEGNYHGRGLPLLKRMCDSVHYLGAGNILEMVLRWENPEAKVA